MIGIKLEVSSPSGLPSFWGTEILRSSKLGVWAPIDEPGRMHGLPVWNDEQVSYDIGKNPTGLAVDLADGVSLAATEILSVVPSGGGGTGTVAIVVYDNSGSQTLPDSTETQVVCDTVMLNTSPSDLDVNGSGGWTVHTAGMYQLIANLEILEASAQSDVYARLLVNGSQYWVEGGSFFSSAPAQSITLATNQPMSASDDVTVTAFQNGGIAVAMYAHMSLQLLVAD